MKSFNDARIDIYDDMAEALDDGESIQGILTKRIGRAQDRKQNVALVYEKWFRNIERGVSLPEAAKKDIKPFDFMVLSAFEESGKISDGMRFLSNSIQKLNTASSKFKTALVAPGIVMAIALAMLVGFSLYAVPLIASIYPPERWPTIGKVLYGVSNGVKNYGILVFAAIFILILGIIYSLERLTGEPRRVLDKWPVYKTYKQLHGLNALVALASQLKVGVSLIKSIDTIRAQSSPYMAWRLGEIIERLAVKPDDFGEAFDVGLYEEDILFRLIDFSERSSFPQAIERVGLQSFDKAIVTIEASSRKMGFLATAFSGVLITFLVVSMLFTAQGIQSDVQRQASSQAR